MAHMQVLNCLTCLAVASAVTFDGLCAMSASQALRDCGISEMLHSKILDTQPTIDMWLKNKWAPNKANVKSEAVLSLAWPSYLQELAASKTPVTQAGPHLLRVLHDPDSAI